MLRIFIDGEEIPISLEIFTHWTPVCFFQNLKSRNVQWEINRQLLAKENLNLAEEIYEADWLLNEGGKHERLH